MVQSVEAYVTT